MKKLLKMALLAVPAALVIAGCGSKPGPVSTDGGDSTNTGEFKWVAEQLYDLRILRYQVEGFEALPLQQKTMLYYLYEAALSGRDMIYDQNYEHNLTVRRTCENILNTYKGDKKSPEFEKFHSYLKRVWFSNGIHHHYSYEKFIPEFSHEWFVEAAKNSDPAGFPLGQGENLDGLLARLKPIMWDPAVDFKRVNKDAGADKIAMSANNFYGPGITEAEVKAFYEKMSIPGDTTPPSYGLNSKLVKENGKLVEKVWKSGGMYGPAIDKVVFWLDKAAGVAENEAQKKSIQLLADYYRSGSLKGWDAYNIAWVADTLSDVDFNNGFIEVYGDALGYRASYESVVAVKDPVASKRIEAISKNAQWFEDNSPLMPEHKKKEVKGISARVINVVMEAGDASPSTPVGINLPNSNWIREDYGSKSVSLSNIKKAYEEAGKSSGILEEFAWDSTEIALAKKHGALADALHTDMHEVIGHASGQLNPGVAEPHKTLGEYASTLEEARADLVALYYLMDPKLVELGVMESLDVGKAEYQSYIRNGLMLQLRRIEPGKNLEEDHMRNRQLVASWVMEKGAANKVIERKQRDGKTYFVVNDYEACRKLFGDLLREIQRIKSEGDTKAARELVENYGVKVDQALRDEVHNRVERLHIPPYAGFINPKLVPVMDDKGNITDVKIEYPEDFTQQHLEYSKTHSFLPHNN
jgi:dipeptidyl-peptidase-3